MDEYLTPAEAAIRLGISRPTITRCVQNGAPVHRWGSCGRHYRILLPEFISWMEAQGTEKPKQPRRELSIAELRARRHKLVSGQ